MKKEYCDGCGQLKMVKRIELGGGTGANFCASCLKKEIGWRRKRNKTLSGNARYRTKYKTNY